jgi:hypothetical protein
MAIIVPVPQQQGVSADPTQIQGPTATHTATMGALARVGQEGFSLFADLAEKHKNLEDAKYASESALQDTLEYERAFQDAKKQASGGVMPDGRGVGEHMNEWIADRQKQRIDSAPSNAAATHYQNTIGGFYVKQAVDAEHFESDQRLQAFDDSITQQTNDLASEYARGGVDPAKVHTHAQILLSQIDAGEGQLYYGKKDAAERKQKVLDRLNDGLFVGAMANKQYNTGLAYFGAGDKSPVKSLQLDGITAKYLGLADANTPDNGTVTLPDFTDPQSTQAQAATAPAGDLTSGMNAVKRGDYIIRLQEARDRELREKLAGAGEMKANYEAALMEGKPRDPAYEGTLTSLLTRVDRSGRAAKQVAAEFAGLGAVSQTVSELAQMPRGQEATAKANVQRAIETSRSQVAGVDKYAGEAMGRRLEKMSDVMIEQEYRKRDEDFAGHMTETDRGAADLAAQAMPTANGINGTALGEFAGQMAAKAKALGESSNVRVLSKEMSAAYGSYLSQLPIGAKTDAVMQIWSQAGQNSKLVFGQLIKDKMVPEGLRVGLNAEGVGKQYMENVVANAYNAKAIKERAENGVYSSDPKNFSPESRKQSLSKSFAGWESAMGQASQQGDQDPTILAYRQQIETERDKIMANSPGKSLESASKEATSAIMDPAFFPPIHAGNSVAVVPRVANGVTVNQEVAGAFMRESLKTDNIGTLGIKEPTLEPLVHSRGYWVLDPMTNAFRLHVTDAHGVDAIVPGKDGKPIEQPIDKLMSDTPDYVTRGTRGFFQFSLDPKALFNRGTNPPKGGK